MEIAIQPQLEIGVFMALGLCAPLVNVPVLLAILSSSTLRIQKEFVIIAGLSISDAVNGLVFFFVAVHRWIVVGEGREKALASRWHCLTTVPQMASITSDLAFGWMLLVVTLDRFFAVFAPIRYFKLGHLYAWKMLAAVLFKSLLCLLIAFIVTKGDDTPEVSSLCYTSDSIDRDLSLVFAIIRIAAVAFSIVLYVPICGRIYMIAKQKRLGRYSTRRYTQLKNMTITVALSSISGVVFVLIPDTIAAFDLFGLTKFSSYFFVLILARSVATVSIYVFRGVVFEVLCPNASLQKSAIEWTNETIDLSLERNSKPKYLAVHDRPIQLAKETIISAFLNGRERRRRDKKRRLEVNTRQEK